MLMIRFQRIGRTNAPSFRVVVLEKERSAQAGKIVEQVGSYNPITKALTLNADRIKARISQGAQPTDTVKNLLISQGIINGKKVNVLPKKSPAKKEDEPATASPVPSTEPAPSTENASEAPTETEIASEAAATPIEETAAA